MVDFSVGFNRTETRMQPEIYTHIGIGHRHDSKQTVSDYKTTLVLR